MTKRILLGLVVLFAVLQFFRPHKNLSSGPQTNDIMVRFPTPPDVKAALRAACYDCHSNETRYPLYAEVQPVAWWIASHVKQGKSELNFSEFGALPAKRAVRKLQQLVEEIENHDMPLKSYTVLHSDARLTEAQIKQISDWADNVRSKFPAESKK